MKFGAIAGALFCCLLCGCGTTIQSPELSPTKAATGLTGGFEPNETLHVYSSDHAGQRRGIIKATGDTYNYGPVARDIEIIPPETGPTDDVNQMIAAKRVKVLGGCSKDKMSDKTTCRLNILPLGVVSSKITNVKGGLYQIVDLNGKLLSSCVIGHDFPGTTAAIRVDNNPAFTTNDQGCIGGAKAASLEKQLVNGRKLTTRRVEWPYKSELHNEMIIDGSISAALRLYRWSTTADLEKLFAMR